MFQEEYFTLAKAAESKSKFLKANPLGYWIAAMLAGIYVGFGILLIFSLGGMISSQPYVKIVMGMSFGIALLLLWLVRNCLPATIWSWPEECLAVP